MVPRLENSVKSLFRGLVAGDGDVYSRMASSHEGATAPYPEPLAGIVNAIKADFDRGKFSDLAFQDGEKLLEAKISDTDIEIKMLNPEDEENRNLEDERQKKNALPVNPAEILV